MYALRTARAGTEAPSDQPAAPKRRTIARMARSLARLARIAAAAVLALPVIAACSDDAEPPPPENLPPEPDDDGGSGSEASTDATTADVAPLPCSFDPSAPVSFEERRLANRLPGKTVPFAKELLAGTGFDIFEGALADAICKDGKTNAHGFDEAKKIVTAEGAKVWRAAVERVQGKRTMGTLPAGDDRMLYWARLTMTKKLRQWKPAFPLSETERSDLEWELERSSRGQYDIVLPTGATYVRVLLSGFDPFTLGEPGDFEDTAIRTGNPSGASALAFDGLEIPLPNGKTAHLETFTLPVSYGPFEKGMQEDTLGPWFKAGPSRVDVAITMSQGGGYRFKLEEYNSRFHGVFEGNDDVRTCLGASPLPSTPGCSIDPPKRWTGYDPLPWTKNQPPQFVDSTLPIAEMIGANTGTRVPRPPGSTASAGNAFDVVWGYDFAIFGDCASPTTTTLYSPVSTTYPPPGNPQPPVAAACARSGGGGDYLSNESAYRATLLRDVLGLTIPAGHIHTPVMTRFDAGNDSAITDATYEAYRSAIVLQGRLLVIEVAKTR